MLNLLKTIIIPIIHLALILLYIGLLSVTTLIEIATWLQYTVYTAISIKVVPEQSGKVEYEREMLPGIAMKIH